MRIDACFDSHVHWLATGEFSGRLRLHEMLGPQDVERLQIQPSHHRGDWLLGFGWDDTKWTVPPHRQFLDAHFPHTPVIFTRCDAHAIWVNSEALRRAGLSSESIPELEALKGGRVERDAAGNLTGVLVDQATAWMERLIPARTSVEIRRDLLRAVRTFNAEGFTHIRDMTCDEAQWNEAVKLDQAGLLTLAVEEYFWLKSIEELEPILELASRARREQTANLRVKGLKIFLDGALGSEGAWLSRCYHGSSENRGLVLWARQDLKRALSVVWAQGFDVAVHAIGDQAMDEIVGLVCELNQQGHSGRTHIEHAEIIRPETLARMRGLDVECHMQPCHWLSDHRWLRDKVGDLAAHAFPWRQLQEAGVAFDFGSDAPIEAPGVHRTLRALREANQHGTAQPLGEQTLFMRHRDLSWAPNSFAVFEGERPVQVVFRGENLI